MSTDLPMVYIASPYTKGDPAINVATQHRVWDQLADSRVVVPVAPLWSHYQHIYRPHKYEFWLQWALALAARCDACLRVDARCDQTGYLQTESSGADREVALFRKLDRPVFYSVEHVLAWARG